MSRIDFTPMNRLNLLTPLRQTLLALVFCLGVKVTLAAPGAHGPNGEHLDGPPATSTATSTVPKMEAQSELFELVARLSGGELSILIDRFATNEPVLKADVEVESGALKAKAKFHPDLGDYAVDDPAMLKLLSQPGEHAVVVTVVAGDDSDLLDAVLRVGAGQAQAATQAHDHGHEHAAYAVGDLLDGRLGTGGLVHEADDAGEQRLFVADLRGTRRPAARGSRER